MPSISAFEDTPRAYVRVEVNWADTPSVEYAKVVRVNEATGECVPLRPYICFNGDYLLLSCGHGIFWDTEAPLDVDFHYTTEGLDAPCIPAADPCAPCVPVTATSGTVNIDSGGAFAFGDPVRPCHDFRVPLCFVSTADPDCVPGSGVFFASMDTENHETNSLLLNPTNASLPLLMSRQMRGISSALTLVTRTFPDRDALLALAQPGGPLLWRGVPEYGIVDQYMAPAGVSVERGLSDHRVSVRVNTLPYTQVSRPAGSSQGVCGSQVDDMCDIYDTWQELETAGLNWDDLIRGRASTDGGNPIGDYRTWDDVEADFADWNAVDDGTRTWIALEEGA